jgi:hypothetical protein
MVSFMMMLTNSTKTTDQTTYWIIRPHYIQTSKTIQSIHFQKTAQISTLNQYDSSQYGKEHLELKKPLCTQQ